jgi:hypothetical protein
MEFVADPERLLYRASSIEFTLQPSLGDSEVTADLGDREAQNFGRLFSGEAAEEAHFNELAFQGIGARELIESVIDGEKQGRAVGGWDVDSRQG